MTARAALLPRRPHLPRQRPSRLSKPPDLKRPLLADLHEEADMLEHLGMAAALMIGLGDLAARDLHAQLATAIRERFSQQSLLVIVDFHHHPR